MWCVDPLWWRPVQRPTWVFGFDGDPNDRRRLKVEWGEGRAGGRGGEGGRLQHTLVQTTDTCKTKWEGHVCDIQCSSERHLIQTKLCLWQKLNQVQWLTWIPRPRPHRFVRLSFCQFVWLFVVCLWRMVLVWRLRLKSTRWIYSSSDTDYTRLSNIQSNCSCSPRSTWRCKITWLLFTCWTAQTSTETGIGQVSCLSKVLLRLCVSCSFRILVWTHVRKCVKMCENLKIPFRTSE